MNKATPLPRAMPQIVWRAGLDLNPLDPRNPSQVGWLESLVWPEQTQRLANLRAALRIAAAHRPRNAKGDLLGDGLVQLCREAPKDVTRVVFHSAVLAYVADPRHREQFADRVQRLCQYWIANEHPSIFPHIASRAEASGRPDRFLLSVNGVPMAWADPHGVSLEWIAGNDRAPIGNDAGVI